MDGQGLLALQQVDLRGEEALLDGELEAVDGDLDHVGVGPARNLDGLLVRGLGVHRRHDVLQHGRGDVVPDVDGLLEGVAGHVLRDDGDGVGALVLDG